MGIKITDLAQITGILDDVLFELANDPLGTPVSRSITWGNLKNEVGVYGKIDQTLTTNRTINQDGRYLIHQSNGTSYWQVDGTNDGFYYDYGLRRGAIGTEFPTSKFHVRGNTGENIAIWETSVGTDIFTIQSTGKTLSEGNVVSWFNDTVDLSTGGLAINLLNGWGTSAWKADLVVWPHVTTRGVDARFYTPINEEGGIFVGRTNAGDTFGVSLKYDATSGAELGTVNCSQDILLKTSAATGNRKISINPRNIASKEFEILAMASSGHTYYSPKGIRNFASDAAANADGDIPSGAMYTVTAENQSIRIKA